MKHAVVSFPKQRILLLKFEKTHFARSELKIHFRENEILHKFHGLVRQTTKIWQPLKNTNSFYDPFFLIRR